MSGEIIAPAADGGTAAGASAPAAAPAAALPITPAEAQAEIARIYADPAHPYVKGDRAAADHMMALHAIAHPGEVDGDVSVPMIDAARTIEAPGLPPADPDGYSLVRLQLPRPHDGAAERDTAADIEVIRELQGIAHEAGAATAEWDNLIGAYNDHARIYSRSPNEARFFETVAEIGQSTDARLREEWGADYQKNLATVRAFTRARGERFVDFLESTGLGNDLRTVRAVLAAAQRRKAA